MAEWIVTFPIYGQASAFVEAETEDEALRVFREAGGDDVEIEQWQLAEQCKGNVCYRTEFDSIDVELNSTS